MNNKLNDCIYDGLKQIGFQTTKFQVHQLNAYLRELDKWNQTYNLTRIAVKDRIRKIIFESAAAGNAVSNYCSGVKWADLGSGAGIPGLILAIMYPDRRFDLIDSKLKAVDFLHHVKIKLKLDNVCVVRERSEDIQRLEEDKYDIVTARAVAPVKKVIVLSRHLLKSDGYLIVPGGRLMSGKGVLLDIESMMWQMVQDKINIPMQSKEEACLILRKRSEKP